MRIFGMGVPELALILAVVLLIFGPKNLPKLGGMLGRGVKKLRGRVETDQAAICPAPSSPYQTHSGGQSQRRAHGQVGYLACSLAPLLEFALDPHAHDRYNTDSRPHGRYPWSGSSVGRAAD